MSFDRRRFLTDTSMALAAITGSSLLGNSKPAEKVEVKTADGQLRGAHQGDLVTFKGVPYAGPVAGQGRSRHCRRGVGCPGWSRHGPPRPDA